MKTSELNEKNFKIQKKLEALSRQLEAIPSIEKMPVDELFQEVQAALEELQVAEEEFLRQNEEIREAQETVSIERQRYRELFDFAPDAYLVTDQHGLILEANLASFLLFQVEIDLLIRKPLSIFIVQEDRRAFRTHINQARIRHQTFEWETRLLSHPRSSNPIPVNIRMTSSGLEDDHVLRWIIRDIRRQKKDQQMILEKRSQVGLLQEISAMANSSKTIEEALQFAVDRICMYTGWPVGHVFVKDAYGKQELVSTSIWHLDSPKKFHKFQEMTESIRLAPGEGLSGQVLLTQKALWIPDVTQSSGLQRAFRSPDTPVKAGLFFPIRTSKEVAGVLEFFSEEAAEPNPAILEIMENVGTQLGRVFERVQSEERLRQEKDFTQSVIDSSYNGILAFDRQFRITVWNPKMEAITGLAKDGLIGSNAFQVLPFLEETGERVYMERALQGESSASHDGKYDIPSTGRKGSFEGFYSPIQDGNGEVRGGLCIFHETTAQKRTGKLLRQQSQLIRMAVSVAPVIFFIIDRDGIVRLSMGRSLARLQNRKEIIGKPIEEVYPDLPLVKENFQRALSGETFSSMVEVGDLVFDTRYTPLKDESGKITGVVGVSVDVTEQRRVEKALRASELRFRTIFEEADMGIDLESLDGYIIQSNPALQEMLGYTAQELQNMHFKDFTHPEDIGRSLRLFKGMVAGEYDRYQIEKRYLHKDGKTVWAQLRASLFRDEEGQPQFAIVMIDDVTTQKQMETELAEVERRLIDSREVERLHLAQELHDGPVQDLLGATYRLSSIPAADLDSSSQDQLAAARSTAQEVMNTLRVICGELRPPALAPFGLEKAIRSHAGQVQELHPEIKIGLDLMPDGQSISERVRLALYRIYQHALLNVIRHAQARSVLVHFAFDSEQIELEVRDDGLGFEFPNRIVNMVREGHFGLVGAAERAQAIGGRLEVFSLSGKGTTVRVTVPRDESLQIPSTTQLAVFPLEE